MPLIMPSSLSIELYHLFSKTNHHTPPYLTRNLTLIPSNILVVLHLHPYFNHIKPNLMQDQEYLSSWGYKSRYQGYTLLDLNSKETFISRNVSFHDHTLSFPSNNTNPNHNQEVYQETPHMSCHLSSSTMLISLNNTQ